MFDNIMCIWQVMCYEPYDGGHSTFNCAKKETADYLRDWCEAIEHDRILNVAKKHGWSDRWVQSVNRNEYTTEESEVILD